jgi:hypothetical protein
MGKAHPGAPSLNGHFAKLWRTHCLNCSKCPRPDLCRSIGKRATALCAVTICITVICLINLSPAKLASPAREGPNAFDLGLGPGRICNWSAHASYDVSSKFHAYSAQPITDGTGARFTKYRTRVHKDLMLQPPTCEVCCGLTKRMSCLADWKLHMISLWKQETNRSRLERTTRRKEAWIVESISRLNVGKPECVCLASMECATPLDLKLPSRCARRIRHVAEDSMTIVVPFSRNDSPRSRTLALYTFVSSLRESACSQENVFVVFVTSKPDQHLVVDAVKTEISSSSCRTLISTVTYRPSFTDAYGTEIFSRAAALREGIKFSKRTQLVLLMDIDVTFDGSLISKCRALASQPADAYFPAVIMKYPYRMRAGNLFDSEGFWGSAGFGMACLRRSLFDLAGGFGGDEETRFSDWGREDHALLENILRFNVSVHRSPDFAIQHNWHSKVCNPSSKYFEFCVQSLRRSLGP